MKRSRSLAALLVAFSPLLVPRIAAADAATFAPAGRGQQALAVRVEAAGVRVKVCASGACEAEGGAVIAVPDEAKAALPRGAAALREIEGGRRIVRVDLPLEKGDPGATWTLLVAAPLTGKGSEPVVVWSGFVGMSKGEHGEGRATVIVDEPGARRVLVGERREDVTLCGRPTLVAAKEIDPATLSLGRAASVQNLDPKEIARAVKIAATRIPEGEAPAGGVRLLRATAASSAVEQKLGTLTDGDAETIWSENKAGIGAGEFVSMSSASEVGITAFTITVRPKADVEGAPRRGRSTSRRRIASSRSSSPRTRGSSRRAALRGEAARRAARLVRGRGHRRRVRGGLEERSDLEAPAGDAGRDRGGDGLRRGHPRGPGGRARGRQRSLARGGGAARARRRGGEPGGHRRLRQARRRGQAARRGDRRRGAVLGAGALLRGALRRARCAEGSPARGAGEVDPELAHARDQLRRCGRASAVALGKLVAEGPPQVSRLAAIELSLVAPAEAIPILVDALNKADDAGRRELRAALSRAVKSPRAQAAYAEELAPAKLGTRSPVTVIDLLRAAGPALPQIEGARPLFASLAVPTAPMSSRYLLQAPAAALASAGDGGAEAFLRATLRRDADPHLRTRAAEVAGSVEALRPDLALAVDDPEVRVREAAINSFAAADRAAPKGLGEALARRLATDDWTIIRSAAARTIGTLPATPALDAALAAALADLYPEVRGQAIDALGAHKATAYAEPLRKRALLAEESLEVRTRAVLALAEMCDKGSLELWTKLAEKSVKPVDERDRRLGAAAVAALSVFHPSDLAQRLSTLLGKRRAARGERDGEVGNRRAGWLSVSRSVICG